MRQAWQLDPEDGGYAGELTATLKDCRKYDEAMAAGRQYLQRHPDHLFIAATVAQAEYAKTGKPDALRAFARRTVATEERSRFLYLQLMNARMVGDWAEAIRLNREQRYFDGDTDTPRWMQDVLAAATLAEAGDLSAARVRAAEAMPVMNTELARQPLSPHLWASLSLGHALLGEEAEAVRCGDKAREALPESRDALQGPIISGLCASALAWAGEKERALAEFERLLHVVYGINPVFDRGIYSGSWKPLRGDPRFEALLADPKNNAPFF
jgi:tetratricopeptide (TPR) repeat protein